MFTFFIVLVCIFISVLFYLLVVSLCDYFEDLRFLTMKKEDLVRERINTERQIQRYLKYRKQILI